MPRKRHLSFEALEPRCLLSADGVLWHDLDGDGVRAADEPGIADAQLNLLDASAQVSASTESNSGGHYAFPAVTAGNYRVQLANDNFLSGGVLEGFRLAERGAGSDPDLDSDFIAQLFQTDAFDLADATAAPTLDAGLFLPATIRGSTFQDANGDGYRALNESGQPGRTVQLRTPGAQAIVSSGELFERPLGLVLEEDGALVVVNRVSSDLFNSISVVRVNADTGQQEAVSAGAPHLHTPVALAIDGDGDFLVLDIQNKNLVSIDSQTGDQSVVTVGDEITHPTGIAVENDGNILFTNGSTGRLVRVARSSGTQEVLSEGGEMVWPSAVTVEPDGQIIVGDRIGKIIRIDPISGSQQLIAEGADLVQPGGIVAAPSGDIFVVSEETRKVVRVDPETGSQIVVAEGGDFKQPSGIVLGTEGHLIVIDQSAFLGDGALFQVTPRQMVGEAITSADGGFSFTDLDPQRYELYVVPQDDWRATTQNPLIVQVNSGEQETRELGSFATASLSGTKYHDLDGDGVLDAGEPGQADWTVFLDLDHNGAPSEGEPSTVTGADGSFTFHDLPAGIYRVRTRQKFGWQSSHDPVSVTIDSSQGVTGAHLGSTFGVAMGEVGVVTDLTHLEKTVLLRQEYDNPVVIAKSASFRGGQPTVVRITDVQLDRFSLRLQESSGGSHNDEIVSYLVLEAGVWELPDGTKFEAGTIDTSATARQMSPVAWPVVDFTSPFTTDPVVFSQVQGNNDPSFVSTRQTLLSPRSVRVALEEEEASSHAHGEETIGWLAIEPGTGMWGDLAYQAGQTLVNSRFQRFEFDASLGSAPARLAGLASYHDADPAHLRYRISPEGDFELKVEEDRTVDVEGWHPDEQAAVLAIDTTGDLLYAARQKPNVVFITVDDMNDWIGALGGYAGAVHTPNLDALFSRSAVFTNAHVPGPVCNTSRTSVMTGLHPTTTGILGNGPRLRDIVPDAVTLPAYFRQQGYTTAGYGKLFHSPIPTIGDPTAWDHTAWFGLPYSPQPDDTIDNSLGFQIGSANASASEFRDGRTTAFAVNFLATAPREPFFLGVGLFHPHTPLIAPQEYVDLYPLDEIVLPEIADNEFDDLPAFAIENSINTALHDAVVSGNKWELIVQSYLAQISFADALIGQLVDAIESSPFAANTVIAFWSDHGFHLGEKGHIGKRTLWEESTRVPFAIAGPGIEAGKTIEKSVGLVDLYPTLADLADLPAVPNIDGQSFVELLDEEPAAYDRPAFVFFNTGSAVRSDDWSYIQYADGSEELYDMQNDPDQHTNRAGDATVAEVLQEHRAILASRVSRQLVVDSIRDNPDANPGDGLARDAEGFATLRAAIEEANALPGAQRISFQIPGSAPHRINLTSALPKITDTIHLDGTTETDYAGVPVIELNGSAAGPEAHGIFIMAGGSSVRGLAINRFGRSGIVVDSVDGNTFQANLIGTDLNGTKEQGNGHNGIVLFNSANNLVGGPSRQDGNIVSGNTVYGVYVTGPGSTGNLVSNNVIGLAIDGVSPVGNGLIGLRIGAGASGNRIADNVVSGNGAAGVRLDGHTSSHNVITANRIGRDVTNSRLRGNQGWGVEIWRASGNLVGGEADDSGNVIAGNALGGVGVSGEMARGNAVRRNSIYSNGDASRLGIDLGQDGSTSNDAVATMEDADSGANNLQNFPELTSAILDGATLHITYSVPSAVVHSNYSPGGLVVEFFLADEANGEGQLFLGGDVYTYENATNPSLATLFLTATPLEAGDLLVATATDAQGNTSEFSLSIAVTALLAGD